MTTHQSITLAGLWPNRSGNGMSGGFDKRLNYDDLQRALREGWRVALFENDRRDNDRAPTHRVVLMPPREMDTGPREPGGGRYTQHVTPSQAARATAAQVQREFPGSTATVERRGGRRPDDLDDDIPFSPEVRA